MERKINKLVSHLMRGEISQEEFINFVKRDLYHARREDLRRKTASK